MTEALLKMLLQFTKNIFNFLKGSNQSTLKFTSILQTRIPESFPEVINLLSVSMRETKIISFFFIVQSQYALFFH